MMDFRAKAKPKKTKPVVKKETTVVATSKPEYPTNPIQDLSGILNRLSEMEQQIGELNQLKQSKELAMTAWKGFRKSFRKLCDGSHPDRVTTLSVLDSFFGVKDE